MIESLEDMKKDGKHGVLVEYRGREYVLELTKEETILDKTSLDATLLTKIEEIDKLQIIESTFAPK